MRPVRFITLIIAILLAAFPASAKETAPPNPKTLFTVKSMAWKEKYIIVDIRFPQFNRPALDSLLKEQATSRLDAFMKQAREYQADDIKNGSKREYSLFVDFDIRMLNSSVLSLIYNITEDYGGAHPGTTMLSVAADMRTYKAITLDDIFKPKSNYLSIISKQTISTLMNTLKSPDKNLINSGAGPNAKNYNLFYFREDQIVFVFNPYQVASYAEGVQESVLNLWEEPYSNIVKPDMIKKLSSRFK